VVAVSCGALDALSHCFGEKTKEIRIVDQIYTLATVEHRDAKMSATQGMEYHSMAYMSFSTAMLFPTTAS